MSRGRGAARRRMRSGATAAVVGALVVGMAACGSGGGSKGSGTGADTKPAGGGAGTAEAFVGSVCDAYLAATKTEKQPSKQAQALVRRLRGLKAPAASRAELAALIAAMEGVEQVWTSTDATTTDAFSTAAADASAGYARAATAIGLDPCPRPGATTTTAAAGAKPSWSFDSVARPTDGDGLWLYFNATCPTGATLTGVVSPWEPNPAAPDRSFAALVAGFAAAQPFTGAVADDAFARRPDFTGTCA